MSSDSERSLTLVRHSLSKLDASIPPNQWGLSAEGRKLCIPLAERVAVQHPRVIVTSEEPKARETGEIAAQHLGLPCFTAINLHEHLRQRDPVFNREVFLARIEALFAQPDKLVFGLESANQAALRFTEAVQAVMAAYPDGNVAIVTHGTVMSLYYGRITGENVWQFWRQLGLPAFYTVSWPGRVVLSRVMQI